MLAFRVMCFFVGISFRCIQDVNTGLGKVLGYITSVKGLSSIRDEVWQLLHEVGLSADENMFT